MAHHQAITIALAITEVPPEERHELYHEVQKELVRLNQNYQASLFNLIGVCDSKSIEPLNLLVAALRGAIRA